MRRTRRRDDDRWFRELIDNLGDMVCRYSVDTTILYVNRAYAQYFGVRPQDLIGRSYLELVLPEAREASRANTERLSRLLTPEAPMAITEHASAVIDGQLRWLQWSDRALFDADGTLGGFVSVGRDVTERRLAEDEIRQRATFDALTGLRNRRSVLETLEGCIAESARTGEPLGVLFLDLDGFKKMNDTWGHRFGDEILRSVAALMGRVVRTTDIAGRLGGDEFVVLCPHCGDAEELVQLGERLEHALAALEPPIGVSVGAVICSGEESADDVLHRADQQMYEVKLGRRSTLAARADQPAA